MQHKSLTLISAILLAALLSGCRTAPVHNVTNAPVAISKVKYQQDDVRKAILRAGGTLGWQMRDQSSGHIVGTLSLRSHVAVVDVHYDTSNYSIKYKDSTNLKYDGTSIHSNYNGWVENLDRAIRAQLQTL
jgi:PBP1b-binding outer membrane lipoprotein LpoB